MILGFQIIWLCHNNGGGGPASDHHTWSPWSATARKKGFLFPFAQVFSAFDIAGKYRKFLSVLKLQANIGALGPDLIVQAVVLCLHRSLTSTLKQIHKTNKLDTLKK